MQALCFVFQSLSSYASCLFDTEGLILILSSILSDSCNHSVSSEGFHKIWGEGFDSDLSFRLSLCLMANCGCLDKFLSISRESLSYDGARKVPELPV